MAWCGNEPSRDHTLEAEPWVLSWSCPDLQGEPDSMWLLAREEGTDCAEEFATWKVYIKKKMLAGKYWCLYKATYKVIRPIF